MKTKDKALLIFSVIFFVAILIVNFLVLDNSGPSIAVKDLPIVACDVNKEDLLDYASAEDKHLKSLFIEENDLQEIIDSKTVTFVAIDEANNITKESVSIDIDEALQKYTLEQIKPLQIQVNTNFNASDYFELKNGCGQTIESKILLQGFNNKVVGTYEATVSSLKYATEELTVNVVVDDFTKPKISLNETAIEKYAGVYFDDEYFMDFVGSVSDDVDDNNYLLENIDINWKEVLNADEDGYVYDAGDYYVTYTVTDSDGNISNVNLEVIIEELPSISEEPTAF